MLRGYPDFEKPNNPLGALKFSCGRGLRSARSKLLEEVPATTFPLRTYQRFTIILEYLKKVKGPQDNVESSKCYKTRIGYSKCQSRAVNCIP
jgi:hypothetical protein